MRRPGRLAAAGAGFVALYVVVAALTFRLGMMPIRPMYEGAPIQSYQWVNPPPETADQNTPPQPGTGELPIEKTGTRPGNVSTPEAQASLLAGPDAFATRSGETAVRLTVTPVDPTTIGDPPPGFLYDGNAYTFDAVYAPSGVPAAPAASDCSRDLCPTILLRYPIAATEMFRREGDRWVKLASTRFNASFQISGESAQLGTFVAVHVPGAKRPASNFVGLLLGIGALLGGTMLAAKRARNRDARAAGKGKPQQKRGKRKTLRSVRRWLKS